MHTSLRSALIIGSLVGMTGFMSGCSTTDGKSATNPRQPGPAIGQGVGAVVGSVGGNVVGAGVGVVEGASSAAKGVFTNEPRVVRVWRTETTSDGRTIQVPYEILVDQYGRPIGDKKK
ncbi:flagellar motor protein MotB [Rariglobus hedericola]|uniref:Flagellar motor protein MotB n=1 Tax=Rariglobus hedericola TaxID=2597822 RepID=A0A556QIY7_9BACT|nr:flagellar motor protein MotB [Rariglobus hedericola]TSJ76581.1 flagellar motor protein MotB [Rariglobus hedericola]